MKVSQNGTTEEDIYTATTNLTIFDRETYERNQTIIAFYQTYDVMTGVRIAATLGGFFGLMVILVLYKSKSKTEKALEDPNFTAAAVAEVEEEDERQLAATILEQTNLYQQLNPRKSRRSLDISNMSSSTGWIKQTRRFSSVGSGGYSNLMEPPIRTHSHLPCFIDEDTPPEEDRSVYDDIYYNRHLDVPRRSSNITCSSSGSSYLERRDSSVAIGIPALPGHKSYLPNKNPRRLSSPLLEIYDFYYPIDIKVIQPTPGGSPCGSDRALYDHINQPSPSIINNNHNHNHTNNNTNNLHQRLAPLASISSCNSSLGTDNPDIDLTSYDSVFHDKNGDSDDDDDDDHDTDDEIESFSTDSEITDCYNCKFKKEFNESLSTPVNEQQSFQSSKSTLTLIDNNRVVNDGIATTSNIDLDEKRPQETLF